MGSLALAAICVVAGPLTTLTLCLSPSPTFILFASVLAALTDAAMFLMWLCYFGYSKIGQTAFLLVISYALGSVLCLAAIALGHNAMVALSAAAPIASGIAFIAATRNDAAAQGESLFEPTDRPSNVSNIGMPKSLVFASIALALYAFVFAFFWHAPLHRNMLSQAVPYFRHCAISLRRRLSSAHCSFRKKALAFTGSTAAFH